MGGANARVHGAHQQIVFVLEVGARRAERGGAANLRELPAVAWRDLGHQDVAALHRAAVRRRHRRIAGTGAEQQEIVLGPECLGVPLEFERKRVLAHAGPRDVDEARIAEFGDTGSFARVGDIFHRLGGRRIEHDAVGGPGVR